MKHMNVHPVLFVRVDLKYVLAFAFEYWTHYFTLLIKIRSEAPLADLATLLIILVSQLGLDHLAVEAGDVGDGLVLRTYGLAGASVGAVTEAELIHFGNHVLHTTGSLYATLGKQGELADLAGYEEHGGAVLTGCYASATADAAGAVHSLVGILLGDEDGVGILGLTSADGGIAASLDDLIEGVTVYHTVLDHGEGSRAPRFDGDDVAIVEAAHIELTGGGTTLGLAMRRTVDVE